MNEITQHERPSSFAAEFQALDSWLDAGTFDQMMKAAEIMARSDLVPQQFVGKPENCFIALDMAKRMRSNVFMLMQNMHVIRGKPGFSAQFKIACANASKVFSSPIRFRHGKDEKLGQWCQAYATQARTGEEVSGAKISMKMVKDEGWYDRKDKYGNYVSKWRTMPEHMFYLRAADYLIRVHAPEITMGMPSTEELEDIPAPRDITPMPDMIESPEPGSIGQVGTFTAHAPKETTVYVRNDPVIKNRDTRTTSQIPATGKPIHGADATLFGAEKYVDPETLQEYDSIEELKAAQVERADEKRRAEDAMAEVPSEVALRHDEDWPLGLYWNSNTETYTDKSGTPFDSALHSVSATTQLPVMTDSGLFDSRWIMAASSADADLSDIDISQLPPDAKFERGWPHGLFYSDSVGGYVDLTGAKHDTTRHGMAANGLPAMLKSGAFRAKRGTATNNPPPVDNPLLEASHQSQQAQNELTGNRPPSGKIEITEQTGVTVEEIPFTLDGSPTERAEPENPFNDAAVDNMIDAIDRAPDTATLTKLLQWRHRVPNARIEAVDEALRVADERVTEAGK